MVRYKALIKDRNGERAAIFKTVTSVTYVVDWTGMPTETQIKGTTSLN